MQRARITTQTVEEIEDVIDVIDVIFEDGIVEPHELALLRHEVSEAHYAAGYADASLAAALSIARTGPESRRSRDTMRDVADLMKYREHKERHHCANSDDAA